MMSPATEPLPYAAPDRTDNVGWHYRLAVICGSAPLIFGTSVLAAFVVTGHECLAFAGLCTIVAGLISFAVGTGSLIRYAREERGRCGRLDISARLWILGAAVLLLANFPTAVFCLAVGAQLIKGDW